MTHRPAPSWNVIDAVAALSLLEQVRLIAANDRPAVEDVLAPGFVLGNHAARASGIHLHIKVRDVAGLPRSWLAREGWRIAFERPGYIVVDAARAISLSFSSIPIAMDHSDGSRAAAPFIDHIGFDFPAAMPVRPTLDGIEADARRLGWPTVAQGGERPVVCCYASVAEKLWVFPPASRGRPVPALEFSAGSQDDHPGAMGEDLRPARPDVASPHDGPCHPRRRSAVP